MISRSLRVVALLPLLAPLGCHRARRPFIAVIPETTAQEIWESAHFEAVRIASPWKWDIFWNGPSREDDLLQQIRIVDEQVDRGAEGIILAPNHAVALISPVRAAVAKKIPVVILDNPLAASPKEDVAFILNDHAATGRIAAERVSHYLKGRHNEVALLGVHPDFLGSLQAADAFKKTLQQYDPEAQVTEERTILGFSEAQDSAMELLKKHPALRAIVALNVTQTRAAFSAIARSNLVGKVAVVACEQDFDVIYRVRTGEIDSAIAIDTRTMVREALQWIHHRREGGATGETILVAPTLVTRQNVDSPEVQRVLSVSGDGQ